MIKDIKTIIQKICDSDIHGSYITDLPPSQIKALKRSQIKGYEKEIPGLKLRSFKNNGDSVVIDLEYHGESFILTFV
jgi:hypothetical protein